MARARSPRSARGREAPRGPGPTDDVARRYQRTLARCTPTAGQYREYRDDIEVFLEATRGAGIPLAIRGDVGATTHLRVRRSVLFERDYLVACVDPAWLGRVAPGCDAIAVPLEPMGGFTRPPLVIIPETQRRSRSPMFRSIVEHEIVHINQALRGELRWSRAPVTIDELLDAFFMHTALEFEAEVLQRVRWPSTSVVPAGVTLLQWCLLSGSTQALQRILRELAHERLEEHLAEAFVAGVPMQSGQRLLTLRLPKDVLTWFEERWPYDVGRTLMVLKSEGIDVAGAVRLRPVVRWLKGQPAFATSSGAATGPAAK